MKPYEAAAYRQRILTNLKNKYGQDCYDSTDKSGPSQADCAKAKLAVRNNYNTQIASRGDKIAGMSDDDALAFKRKLMLRMINNHGADCFDKNDLPLFDDLLQKK